MGDEGLGSGWQEEERSQRATNWLAVVVEEVVKLAVSSSQNDAADTHVNYVCMSGVLLLRWQRGM